MALMVAPCGERMEISRWTRHLVRCRVCLLFWHRQQAKKGD